MMNIEMGINTNEVHTTKALYQADAGIKYTKRQIENLLDGNINQSLDDIVEDLIVQPPPGYTFDAIDNFEMIIPEHLVKFTITGRSAKAQTTIEATIRRLRATSIGIYGDKQVYMFPNTTVYAYNSRVNKNPRASAVPDGANIGSNGYIDFRSNAYLDGTILLGEDENGSPATCANCNSYESVNLEYNIDTDPLGMFNGALQEEFLDAKFNNNNDTTELIVAGALNLDGHTKGTLFSGLYYITSLEIKANATLTIDNDNGPVRIFAEDTIRIWPRAKINYTGEPLGFQIYSTTNEDIKILPQTDFSGMIYAPRADILVFPNGDYNGTIWGNNVYLKPGGRVNIDTSILDRILINKLVVNNWKELRFE
jgi:hypothetical protein